MAIEGRQETRRVQSCRDVESFHSDGREPLLALRARAIERALQLYQRVGPGGGCLSVNQIGHSACRTLFALKPRGSLGEDSHIGRGEIARQKNQRARHARRESYSRRFVSQI